MNRLTAITLAILLAAPAAASEALDIRLRTSASVVGPEVTLADVLSFGPGTEELRQQLASQVIIRDQAGAAAVEVSYQQVHDRLVDAGVNLGRVLLQGAARCHVRLLPAPDPQPQAAADPEGPLFRDVPDKPADTGMPLTLADHIRAYCQEEWRADGGTVELDFERGREDLLGLTAPTFTFVVRSADRTRLGMREFRVTVRRDGHTLRTESVFASVRVLREVLVAAGPLNIGSLIEPDDVKPHERIFTSDAAPGLTRAGEAVGQRVRIFIPEGQLLRRDDLQAADLVKRSAGVRVFSSGPVGVRLQGTALDNGTYGERVRVRLGDTRSSRRVVHGEVTGLGEVRLLEETK